MTTAARKATNLVIALLLALVIAPALAAAITQKAWGGEPNPAETTIG